MQSRNLQECILKVWFRFLKQDFVLFFKGWDVLQTGCFPDSLSGVNTHSSNTNRYENTPWWWWASPSVQMSSYSVGNPRIACPQTGTSPTCVWAAGLEYIYPHSCSIRHVYNNSLLPICHWSLLCPWMMILDLELLCKKKHCCVLQKHLLWQGCRCRARPRTGWSSSRSQALPSHHQTRSTQVCIWEKKHKAKAAYHIRTVNRKPAWSCDLQGKFFETHLTTMLKSSGRSLFITYCWVLKPFFLSIRYKGLNHSYRELYSP